MLVHAQKNYQVADCFQLNSTDYSTSVGNLPVPISPLQFSAVQGRKNPLWMGLPRRLKKTRERAELSHRQLAVLAGCSNGTIGEIEVRGRVPGIDMVEKLARGLGVSVCWLAFGHDGFQPFRWRAPRLIVPFDDPEPVPSPHEELANRYEGAGERLRQARENAALTLNRLAELAAERGKLKLKGARRAPISLQSIAYIETGHIIPKLNTLEALAVALDVSPCWLAYGFEADFAC